MMQKVCKKNKLNPQLHATKQNHRRDLHGHDNEGVFTKKSTKQYWLSPPTLGKIFIGKFSEKMRYFYRQHSPASSGQVTWR